jgi:hypothetical protein
MPNLQNIQFGIEILHKAKLLLIACVFTQTAGAESFDINRFSNAGEGWFETFHVKETHALAESLGAGMVAADTQVLVTETAAGRLAMLTDQMAFHHLAQGTAGGKDWMATF